MLGTKIIVILSTRLTLGCYAGAVTTIALVLGCSTSTTALALASMALPSVLCLAPFSSREAALLKSRAYKRTRIDKEKKNKETKGARSPLITGEGRLRVVGSSRPPQKPKFYRSCMTLYNMVCKLLNLHTIFFIKKTLNFKRIFYIL